MTLLIAITIFLVTALIFILYHRQPIDDSIVYQPVGDNIEDYIDRQESQYTDIIAGTEKRIEWNNPDKKNKTRYVFVYLHGYSASRQEISPVIENLAQSFEANIFFTRLTGHGRKSEAMREITISNLLHDGIEAIEVAKKLGEKIIIVGTSTGATLATWLALQENTHIYSLVFLSPNFALNQKHANLLYLPGAKFIAHLVQGKYYEFEPDNVLQKKYWTTRFPSEALIPMMQLTKIVKRKPLENISIPTFVLYCPEDQVINVSAIHTCINRFGAKILKIQAMKAPIGSKNHILAGDILSPETTNIVVDYISEFLKEVIRKE